MNTQHGEDGRTAVFSDDGTFRYALEWRAEGTEKVLWLMLNPSTADHTSDDRTSSRVSSFSNMLNAGVVRIVNLYAFVNSDVRVLQNNRHPVGPANDQVIEIMVRWADVIVVAWGNLAQRERVLSVWELIKDHDKIISLGRNKTGNPPHPLYLPRKTDFQEWSPPW